MIRQDNVYSTFDAKNKFSELLDRVERGEEIVITRHGKPVAKLIRSTDEDVASRVEAAFEKMRKIREELLARGVRVTTAEIIQWKNEGRK